MNEFWKNKIFEKICIFRPLYVTPMLTPCKIADSTRSPDRGQHRRTGALGTALGYTHTHTHARDGRDAMAVAHAL